MIKIIIKIFLILFLFSNVLVKANDISAMGGISDAAGGAAQAAADQLSSDAGKVAENIAGATEALGEAKSEIGKALDSSISQAETAMKFAQESLAKTIQALQAKGRIRASEQAGLTVQLLLMDEGRQAANQREAINQVLDDENLICVNQKDWHPGVIGIVAARLTEKYKDTNWDILSEENVKTSKTFVTKNDWVWVLDPLDGTKDFIQGTGNYAMHLALNFKQKPFIGFVLIPDKNQLWITDGKKTWCEKRDGTKYKTNLFNNKNLQEMTLVTSKNHGNDVLRNLIQKINFRKVEIMGSIGCKIASIVRGESDIYICLSLPGKSSPKDWDFAAPAAILKASGGKITYLNDEELKYGRSNFEQRGIIIASNNSKNHKNLCLEIDEIIKRNEIYPFDL